MKAFVLRSYGSPGHLDLTDTDKPVPADDEVLVRVRATSVNPYDWHHMRGEPYIARVMPGSLGLRAPKLSILGCDMAGQVESAGKDVTEFRPGDDVFALLSHGGFAEYVTVREGLLARKPENLPYEQAAAVPMAAVTALLGLRGAGKVQPGQKVLVNGASPIISSQSTRALIGKAFCVVDMSLLSSLPSWPEPGSTPGNCSPSDGLCAPASTAVSPASSCEVRRTVIHEVSAQRFASVARTEGSAPMASRSVCG